MSITKVKSKIKSKKFSKNGKNKTMKKNINKKRKTMIGGVWPKIKFWKNKPPKVTPPPAMIKSQQHSQDFWKATPLEAPNLKTHYVPPNIVPRPNAKARARAALKHTIAVAEERKIQPIYLNAERQRLAAVADAQRTRFQRAIPIT